jgi:hypothetical protein
MAGGQVVDGIDAVALGAADFLEEDEGDDSEAKDEDAEDAEVEPQALFDVGVELGHDIAAAVYPCCQVSAGDVLGKLVVEESSEGELEEGCIL